ALNSAQKVAAERRISLYDRLSDFYRKTLDLLEKEITEIDSKLKGQVWVDTFEGKVLKEVREMKVKERDDLYRAIWPQILQSRAQPK
ncbi:MAG: hypothetical protein NTV51_03415, partial [Verrucomicrobia bacterium]|nr:hypothetical protein [Verrucomicrobiota bacterium]